MFSTNKQTKNKQTHNALLGVESFARDSCSSSPVRPWMGGHVLWNGDPNPWILPTCRFQHNQDSPSVYFIFSRSPRPPFQIFLARTTRGFSSTGWVTGSTSDRNHAGGLSTGRVQQSWFWPLLQKSEVFFQHSRWQFLLLFLMARVVLANPYLCSTPGISSGNSLTKSLKRIR